MKWKVRVVQYSEPVIVEAETMQEAQEFVAEQTVMGGDSGDCLCRYEGVPPSDQ